ncbi:hypothetical protein ACVGVM_23270 [Pseudonocardia bannensis]|uniref:Uncharacterized protein n=1 Tax=Pseudonocardia bannensis TaxID=630973 RepID=A0A848DND8_9PSEU|nr:hypothetical protein [Pseudonocardia bannensis]NMH94043.1 hypothetical protein [Pseudonocardia bannensis]
MAYVHGHARETGWVVAHFRRPSAPDDGQLGLALPDPGAPALALAGADRDRDGPAGRGVREPTPAEVEETG